MFRPNLRGLIYRKEGYDIYGQESYSSPQWVGCAVVNLANLVEQTSVRADSTASRGAAEDEVINAKILVPANTQVAEGDKFRVVGFTVEISSVMPRINTQGVTDHLELRAKRKAA